MVPIYKNKGERVMGESILVPIEQVYCSTNYRGIKLMSHTMKLWERVIERCLRAITQVSMNQFGFMPGRSTMEAIFFNKTSYGVV